MNADRHKALKVQNVIRSGKPSGASMSVTLGKVKRCYITSLRQIVLYVIPQTIPRTGHRLSMIRKGHYVRVSISRIYLSICLAHIFCFF